MTEEDVIARLDGVRPTRCGFVARCPGHDDTNPSLSIRRGERCVLLRCWAGCELSAIVDALGLKVSDLFFDGGPRRVRRPPKQEARPNRLALAFRFETAALDHRLRSAAVLRELETLEMSGLTRDALDRLMDVVASAYHDIERAELLESVSDSLRLNEFYGTSGAQHAARLGST